MKKYLLISIMLLTSTVLLSQGLYNNGGKIVIGTGANMYISGNYRNETNVTNGSIDLAGKLKIEGNFTNNVSASDVLTTASAGSEVVFNGTTTQTIGGTTTATFTFPKFTINKTTTNIVLAKNILINDSLKFISGLIDIGANNLTFGPTSSVAGIPSALSMIVAAGAGQVNKVWLPPGAFTFPVGSNSIIAEYSPVSLNFTAGTFAPGSFVGLNLVNSKFNDPAITGSYINRYWNITQTGITGFVCDAVFQYLSSDIVGIENNISCLRVIPPPITTFNTANTTLHQLSATGLSSFGTFTGGPGGLKTLSLKLFLEGFYLSGGLMRQAQGSTGNQFAGTTVDTLTVELHNPMSYVTPVYIAKNINLNTNGTATLTIPGTFGASYYVTVKPRNSIATVSATALSFALPTINYDFTTSNTMAFGNNQKNMAPGIFAMYGGDENVDGAVDGIDLINIENAANAFTTGYVVTDINGDGVIDALDLIITENNALNFVSYLHP